MVNILNNMPNDFIDCHLKGIILNAVHVVRCNIMIALKLVPCHVGYSKQVIDFKLDISIRELFTQNCGALNTTKKTNKYFVDL